MRRVHLSSLILAAVICVCTASFAEACPECKKNFTDNMARGYFWSILFMLSMPFLIITGLGSYFCWEVRRAYAREALEQALAGPEQGSPSLDVGQAS